MALDRSHGGSTRLRRRHCAGCSLRACDRDRSRRATDARAGRAARRACCIEGGVDLELERPVERVVDVESVVDLELERPVDLDLDAQEVAPSRSSTSSGSRSRSAARAAAACSSSSAPRRDLARAVPLPSIEPLGFVLRGARAPRECAAGAARVTLVSPRPRQRRRRRGRDRPIGERTVCAAAVHRNTKHGRSHARRTLSALRSDDPDRGAFVSRAGYARPRRDLLNGDPCRHARRTDRGLARWGAELVGTRAGYCCGGGSGGPACP